MYRLIFFLLLIMSVSSFAQKGKGVVTGKVIDASTSEPLQFATISMTHKNDSNLVNGGLADETGTYKIQGLRFGEWTLSVTFIGYEMVEKNVTLSQQNPAVNLGVIQVNSTVNELEEVEIVAEKSLVETKIDRKVINVGKDLTNVGGSAEEVMANMPGIEVDMDGNISLRGNGNVTVLIDGKPSTLTGGSRQAVLNQIPASAIESVEIITNPSAKYDPDGMAGIINIVLKKNKLSGFSGNATVTYAHDNNINANGGLNYRNKKWNFYTNYAYRVTDRGRFSTSTRDLFLPDSTSTLDILRTGDRVNSSHTFTGGMDYNVSEKSTITLTGNYNYKTKDEDELAEYENFDENQITDLLFNRDNREDEVEYAYGANIYYDKKFDKKGQKLNTYLSYSYSDEYNERRYEEAMFTLDGVLDESLDPFNQDQLSDELVTNIIQAIDYTHPLQNGAKLELGTKVTRRIIEQNSRFYDDTTGNESYGYVEQLSNHFKYTEDVYAAYGTYGGSYKKFDYQAGLRLEQAFTESNLISSNEVFPNDYFSVYPTMHLAYKPSLKNTFSLSYSRRVNRPNFWNLNPFVNFSDPFNLRTGNPFLRPEYINSYEAGYIRYFEKGMLSANAYYKSTYDMISRLVTVDSNGVTTRSWENFAGQQTAGLELNTNLNLTKWMRINASFNMFQNVVDASNLETQTDFSNTNFGYFGRLSANFTPTDRLSFQLSGFYRGRREFAIGYMAPMYACDFGAKYEIIEKKLSAIVQVKDMFDTRRFEIYTEEPSYKQERIYDSESRFVFVGLEYRFGNMKAAGKRRRGGSGGGPGGDDDF